MRFLSGNAGYLGSGAIVATNTLAMIGGDTRQIAAVLTPRGTLLILANWESSFCGKVPICQTRCPKSPARC
jgi:hypothetical protein